MLLSRTEIDGIRAGTIRLVFRRWRACRIAAGGTLTADGTVFGFDQVDALAAEAITGSDARDAGFPTREALLAALARYDGSTMYKIAIRPLSDDPRIGLRATILSSDAMQGVLAKLKRMDGSVAWTEDVLAVIDARSGHAADELARALGMDEGRFKPRVRRLKELGLTESLPTGYRVSQRGKAVLAAMLEARTADGGGVRE